MSEKSKNDRKEWMRYAIAVAVIVMTALGVVSFAALWGNKPDESGPETENITEQALTETDPDKEIEKEPMQEKTGLANVLDEMRPAMVALRNNENNMMGSGFILELQEDVIYICTNRHVIADSEYWEVEFYDGETVTGKKTGVSQVYDVGIVSVETASVPESLLMTLSVVDIDMEYWKTLDGKQLDVGFVSMYQSEEGDECVTGLLLNTLAEFPWDNELRHSEFQIKFADGDSGAAIFDETGRLISMVYGTSYEDESGRPRRWGVPLSGITISYIEIINEVQ